ncbi:MAG: glycosyltransferase family 2 protein [Pseudomonadota bacterium]
MATLPITVIIMTRNEALNLPRCLARCRGFAQIVVVDSHSDDDTLALAQKAGATTMSFSWNGDYPKKKQWCLDNAPIEQPWVLFLDADEYPTPDLCQELETLCHDPQAHDGYYVRARVSHGGQLMRFGRKHCKLALFRTGAGHFPVIDDLDVPGGCEVEGHYQPIIAGSVGYVTGLLVHDDLKPQTAWQDRHHNYALWAAHMRQRQALVTSEQAEPWLRRHLKAALYHIPGRSLLAFIDSYILCLGFLDGRTGWDYARARGRYYGAIDAAYHALTQAAGASSAPGATVPTAPVASVESAD